MNFREPNEDLFETSRMSFGEHLEELRNVLIRALIGVALACVVGFWFADRVVQVLKKPLVDAMYEYDVNDTSKKLTERFGFVPPEYTPWMENEQLIPKQIRIDPGQLVKSLQSVIPDFGEHVDLEPYGFRAKHFEQAKLPALCLRLSQQDGEDPATTAKLKATWSALNIEDQTTIVEVSKKPKANIEDWNTIAEVFNRLLRTDRLSDDDAFKDDLTEEDSSFWTLLETPQPKPLAKIKDKLNEEFDEILSRRLNRALIASLFPEQLPTQKVDLVTIEIWEEGEFEPQALGVAEPFTVWLKAGLFSGIILSGPWIAFQLWSFVATGLYPHEKKHIHVFLPISIFLFIAGVLLAFFFVFQPVLGFLFSFNRTMGIAPEMRINDWLSFVMFLPLGFGLAFQLPLVMLFMNRIGLFSIEDYLSRWRIAVMIIFFLAMFLTPADPISMLLLAVPLTLLYFLGVGMCRWMPRTQNPFGEGAETT